tara:strand:+ start:2124 stop:2603 length:480 start_codon:yes stop_codon:yes gene_type:complete
MSDIVATAAHLIREMGVKIKSGPYHNLRRATRIGKEDVHLFRVRTVLTKKQAGTLGLEYPEKTNWALERSLRFLGTVNKETGLLESLKPIGSSDRKKLGKNVTKRKHLYGGRRKKTTKIVQRGPAENRKISRAGLNKEEGRSHVVCRRYSRKHSGNQSD